MPLVLRAKVLLYQDNAPVHTAQIAVTYAAIGSFKITHAITHQI